MDVDDCPFSAGHDVLPPRVAGRDTAFLAVADLVGELRAEAPSEPVVLTGVPGIGRTAVLRELHDRLPEGWTVVTPEEAGPSAGQVALAALAALSDHLGSLDSGSPALRLARGALESERGAILAGSVEALATVVAPLAMAAAVIEGGASVLLIDDLPGLDLAAHHAVIDGLGAGPRRGFPLGVVVTTLVDPVLGIPGRVVDLAPLTLPDLEDAIRLPAAAKGRPVTNDALEAIALHSEGHPWLAQALMAAAWTPTGEAVTGGLVNQRVPVAQAGYRAALVDHALSQLSSGALRYLRAVATADVVTHSAVSQSLGDTTRFGGGGSALGETRDELRSIGLLRSPDNDQLILPLPGQRLRLLADM